MDHKIDIYIFQVKIERLADKKESVLQLVEPMKKSAENKTLNTNGLSSVQPQNSTPLQPTVKKEAAKESSFLVKVESVEKSTNNVEKYSISTAEKSTNLELVQTSSSLPSSRSDLNLDKSESKKPGGKEKTENKSEKHR